jgi:hypothetical protein
MKYLHVETLRLVEAYCRLSNIEKDKMFAFMGNKGPEITPYNAVPCRPEFVIKVVFDMVRNITFFLVCFQCSSRHRERIALHFAVRTMVVHYICRIDRFDEGVMPEEKIRAAKAERSATNISSRGLTYYRRPSCCLDLLRQYLPS